MQGGCHGFIYIYVCMLCSHNNLDLGTRRDETSRDISGLCGNFQCTGSLINIVDHTNILQCLEE